MPPGEHDKEGLGCFTFENIKYFDSSTSYLNNWITGLIRSIETIEDIVNKAESILLILQGEISTRDRNQGCRRTLLPAKR